MSVKSRIAAAAVLGAAAAALAGPAATASAADKDTRHGHPATVHQVQLPDGSRARLRTGGDGTSVTVTSDGRPARTLDTTRPSADLERLHLRILGGDTARPTLRAQLDGAREANYYDFASGSLRHTPDRPAGTGHHAHQAPAAHRHSRHHELSANPVKRVVDAGEVIKGRQHDLGRPALAGGAALLALGGGAYGIRRLVVRRNAARARQAQADAGQQGA
ncbi:hypothetical protein ACWD4B_05515 [Streptomyces sp. NPDC002536]